jgi:hypothetical protein
MHRSDGPHSRRALHSSIVHDYCGLLRDALRQSPYHPGDVRESVEFLVLHKLTGILLRACPYGLIDWTGSVWSVESIRA